MRVCLGCGKDFPYTACTSLVASFNTLCRECEQKADDEWNRRVKESPIESRACEICQEDYDYHIVDSAYDYRMFSAPGEQSESLCHMCKGCLAKYDAMIGDFLGIAEGGDDD